LQSLLAANGGFFFQPESNQPLIAASHPSAIFCVPLVYCIGHERLRIPVSGWIGPWPLAGCSYHEAPVGGLGSFPHTGAAGGFSCALQLQRRPIAATVNYIYKSAILLAPPVRVIGGDWRPVSDLASSLPHGSLAGFIIHCGGSRFIP
jgi:hypothetical protein